MKYTLSLSVAIAALAVLVACGGGGGTTTPATNPPSTPTPPPASTTNVTLTVVDDGYGTFATPDPLAGQPLAGVLVRVEPWTAGATPLPSPQATTNASGVATLNGVPNGHYILDIGTDSTTDTTWATVHDNVTFTGGSVTLTAPKLAAVPSYTPPAWETNGDYRLAHQDPNAEVPCFQAWNSERTSHSLPTGVVDEWLTENVRANQALFFGASFAGTLYPITTGATGEVGGTGNCATDLINSQIFIGQPSATYAGNPATIWFAGSETTQVAGGGRGSQTQGYAEYPIDPRATADPNYPNWP
jgi:hypothetical protein